MIEINGVSFTYRTGKTDAVPALRDLNLKVNPGQLVAIIGHNGSGKSTLVKLLTAVLYPTEGEIRVDGVLVDRKHQWEVRRKVSVVFQDPALRWIQDRRQEFDESALPRAVVADNRDEMPRLHPEV